ncbi:UNVERIFIED_CONTAM: putative glucose-6-phosphate 1-epimerase [Sesamum angustifolium]|uniref:glucose-6-phosphate 1-epimerase n=1 Tax=Sesamum angustifolium TaxID=2727405 RepID=A0AAW2MI69_9LAMI
MVAAPLTWSFSPTTSAAESQPHREIVEVDVICCRYRAPSSMASSASEENVDNYVKVSDGLGGLPKAILSSVHGSEAEIYLYGGCVTSWRVDNTDLLYVRPDAVFTGLKPISGGIPHCFPQFGPGPMQQHGFARNMNWSIVDSENVDGNPAVTLELRDGPYSRSIWDYSFQALYKVSIDRNTLTTELQVTNTDEKPFSFSTALHTYFRASVSGASVKGLKGCKTLNKDPDPRNPVEGMEDRDVVTFPGFVDCIYVDAPEEVYLDNGLGDSITIKNRNWSDVVLWNPHLTIESCYKDFVCVENAKGKFLSRPGSIEPEPIYGK